MRIRAAIFDVYGTLLELGPAPEPRVAREGWEAMCDELLGHSPPLDLGQIIEACDVMAAREHSVARQRGISYPEVFWPDVVGEVLPVVARLSVTQRDDFLARFARLSHSVRLARGAGVVLRRLQKMGIRLGIASNAQPYTLAELKEALATAGLAVEAFDSRLSFWSFENGFSKPNPHVFQCLTARLRAFGIQPHEVVMVGDRPDNDVEPARAFGWRTWLLRPIAGQDWEALGNWLDCSNAPQTQ